MVDQRVLGLTPRERSAFSDKLEQYARDNDFRGNENGDNHQVTWARYFKFAQRQAEVRGKTQPEQMEAIGEMMEAVLAVISLGIRASEASEIYVKIDDEEVLQDLDLTAATQYTIGIEPKSLSKTKKTRKEGE